MGIFDVDDLNNMKLLQKELSQSPFGEVYLLPYFEEMLFKWTKIDGWQSI
jgi:hypothetical protein